MFHGTGRMSRRLTSLLLAAVLLLGMAPGLILPASAHWADQYLDQLVDWGVMRADQTSDPDAPVTRAEFMAIINRAYGYTQMGPIPFTDVSRDDWFYDDVAIAYNAGYMAGTSATKASPNLKLNREMAVCILARNMMMKETPGENLAFADARNISGWARGLVKTAVDNYIVSGYPNNKFGPQDLVSKGQMASLVVRCIGTPLNKPGEYSLGDVFDNVTITSPGVTLRNTTVSGDLYVSGGVGLGDVRLENVNVLGRIIVSGTGESERGDASVVLRNVTANEMLVDNMKKQLVTLRAEGLTNIAKTVVRTNAYLEDNTPDDRGLRKITLENSGARLDLAGRIKDVVNTAPQSTIKVAKGTVAKLTVDEAAGNSTVQLDRNTEVKELNLDTATNVTGQGDVDKMNVNASGVTSTMLPDEIYIRPGLEANISGENMDTAAAEESSRDPRILSGYPIANDVAPTSLRADFAANKRGTIYWAVSNITDGSVTAEDLISPPSYGSRALKNGSVATPSADTVVPVRITGLTVGGSYYLSAVLVDNRGERSPVKVIAFTTPDNTKPAFAQGYPYMSLVTDTLGQATVMATKSCKLYYAVLPQGAQAPTVNDLRSASVTGNLGYGVMDVVKNTEHTFTVSSRLEELKNYVAYFWLTDADGANSSNIVSVRFTTKDSTRPVFDPEPYLNSDPKDTSVSLTAGLNEAGTIYWVVVPRGETYPKRNPNNPEDNEEFNNEERAKLNSDYARQQVKNGRNATKRGSASVRNAETDVTINITGLAKEAAYDFYYVAQDTAGNFSEWVKMIPINTADNSAPTISQSFSPNGGDASREPLVTSKISITFSEDVCSSAGAGAGKSLLTLRNELADAKTAEEARENLVEFLEKSIELWKTDPSAPPKLVTVWNDKNGNMPNTGDWINFSKAVIVSTTKGGTVTVELPHDADKTKSAHSLSSGATYYFKFKYIEDSSDSHNSMQDGNGKDTTELYWDNMGKTHNIPTFTTVFAQVLLSSPTLDSSRPLRDKDSPDTNHGEDTAVTKDFSFRMIPDATERVDAINSYDLTLFSDTDLAFDLYCRIRDTSVTDATAEGAYLSTKTQAKAGGILAKGDADDNNWFYLGNSGPIVHPADGGAENWRGVSVMGNTGMGNSGTTPYPQVRDLKEKYTYDFIITVTEIAGRKDRKVWTDLVNFEVYVLAGDSGRLSNLAQNSTKENMKKATEQPLTSGGLVSIGTDMQAGRKYLALDWQFSDTRVPEFWEGYPNITAGADWADVKVQLDRAGQYYYVVAPYNGIGTVVEGQQWTGLTLWEQLPKKGQNKAKVDGTFERIYQSKDGEDIKITAPNAQAIMSSNTFQNFKPERLPITYPAGSPEVTIELRKLEPRSKYIIYFVLKGTMDEPSPVFAYAFETTDTGRPHITIRPTQSGTATLETQYPASLYYRMFTTPDAKNIKELTANFSGASKLPAPYNDTTTGIKTVLDALTTVYDHSSLTNSSDTNAKTAADTGASIFDLYASNDEKNAIARLIKENQYTLNTGGSATSVNDGPKTTSGTRDPYSAILTRDDLNKMEFEPTTYVLLVMGHHASSDESREPYEIDAFRAEQNFRRTDTEAPNLTEFSVSNFNNTNGRFSGRMTLKFDKALYWIGPNESATNRVRVDQDNDSYVATSGTTEGSVGITYNHTSAGTLTARTGGNTNGPRDQFIIDFSRIMLDSTQSASFELLPGGKFSNVNGQNIDAALEIRLFENPDRGDGQKMYVNIATGVQPQYIMVAYWNGQMVSKDFRLNN